LSTVNASADEAMTADSPTAANATCAVSAVSDPAAATNPARRLRPIVPRDDERRVRPGQDDEQRPGGGEGQERLGVHRAILRAVHVGA
jgi:hypothetical protein